MRKALIGMGIVFVLGIIVATSSHNALQAQDVGTDPLSQSVQIASDVGTDPLSISTMNV